MRFDELRKCKDFGVASKYSALARVGIANAKLAMEAGHLDRPLVNDFFADVIAWIETSMRKLGVPISSVSIEVLYRAGTAILEGYKASKFFQHRKALNAYLANQAISFQSSAALPFWFDTMRVGEAAAADLDPVTVARLCGMMSDASVLAKGAVVGRPGEVLWLTPLCGRIAQVVARADATLTSGAGLGAMLAQSLANEARDRLGLIRLTVGEHLMATTTRATLGELQSRPDPGPLAPTIFEAKGYERFRHWPQPKAVCAGRTYDLDDRERDTNPVDHGVDEMVYNPLPLTDVSKVTYLGIVDAASDSLDEHLAYADSVAPGFLLTDGLDWIEAEFSL